MVMLRTGLLALLLGILAPLNALADMVEDQVKAAYAEWEAAFNKADAKSVAGFYTQDALLLPPTHEVVEGGAGREKFFSGLFSGGVSNHKLELIRASGDDKVIVAAAKWSAQGKDASGKPATFSGIAMHVFEKQADGSWKLKMHTFN